MQKEKITNYNNYFYCKLFIGMGIFGILFFGYLFFEKLLATGQFLNRPNVIGLFIFLTFYILYSIWVYINLEGIKVLYASDFGIHSKKEKCTWEAISDISLEERLNYPILLIKYYSDEKKGTLKTTLPNLKEDGGSKTYKEIRERWMANKNS